MANFKQIQSPPRLTVVGKVDTRLAKMAIAVVIDPTGKRHFGGQDENRGHRALSFSSV